MRRHGRAAVAAFAFLTRLPVAGLTAHGAADLPLSAAYFPLVGLAVGLLGGGVYFGAVQWWGVVVSVLLSTAATVLATGAFHEDALADALDGFGGGWSREQVLAIMKDSRVGSYALVGVALVLGLKVAVLTSIGAESSAFTVMKALIAGHVLGRWSSVPLLWRCRYVRAGGGDRPSAGGPFADGLSALTVGASTAIAMTIVGIALGQRAVAAIFITLLVTTLAAAYFRRRIGGITGDALGAANQIVEVAVYLTLAAHAVA